jgi:hypothetical protein
MRANEFLTEKKTNKKKKKKIKIKDLPTSKKK